MFDPLSMLEYESPATSNELRVALEAASVGGAILVDYFARRIEFRSKGEQEPFNLVSDADVHAEQAIVRAIRAHFPSHDILGEEEAQGSIEAEHLWIIDPLDGTNNFAHRIPHFAVSIGYYINGQAQCGVVFNPMRGDCYWAERERGAYHNGRRLQVSEAKRLNESMIGIGFYYDRGAMMEATLAAVHAFFKQQIHGVRRFGTAALDLCQVADGMFGTYFEYKLHPWDFAAGRLIVEEAGGMVTTGLGEPVPLTATSLIASNTHLHPAALEIVRKHHL